ncbi:hypothetical protein R6Q59_007815 [Mikania micrantha]
MTGCNDTCGNNVTIPYPFGIGANCAINPWYTIDCNNSTPYLTALNHLEVLAVNLEYRTITLNTPTISYCQNSVQNRSQTMSIDLGTTPFLFSKFSNKFVLEGCGTAAMMDNGTVITGCSTSCMNNDTSTDVTERNNCLGISCCQTTIPHHLKSYSMNATGLGGDGGCGYGFLVDTKSYVEGSFSVGVNNASVPVSLLWNLTSSNTLLCYDLVYDAVDLKNTNFTCRQNDLPTFGSKSSIGVILGVSISVGVLLLVASSYALYKWIKKTKQRRQRKGFFKRNGGLLLKQQEEADPSLVGKTILFTSRELEKATDNFNENRILGRGGQGTVYKGMLVDGRIVAIKKSKVVDESQLEQFINEVVILSQVNHRNVVKLLGCCLETDVPLLVSEFIPNGTLYDRLHNQTDEFSISLNMRLQIATEVAGALAYLHSATSIPIYHRDIKTTNILLDEKYRAKVSDFGTSRFVSTEQTHLTTLVKGTFGYLDPEYFQSSQFTEKSDVYSFGVVLVELLTRERPISLTRFGENRSLATHFMLAMEDGRVMSIFDAVVIKEGTRDKLLSLANLAMRCLNLNGKYRPTMKEVAIELEKVRTSHIPSTVQTSTTPAMYGEEVLMLEYGESSTFLSFNDSISQ